MNISGSISTEELRNHVQATSYQEVIAGSKEYQKIAKNLLECAAFNEKTAGEVMQKVDNINKRKEKAGELVARISQLKKEFSDVQSQCRNVSDVTQLSSSSANSFFLSAIQSTGGRKSCRRRDQ